MLCRNQCHFTLLPDAGAVVLENCVRNSIRTATAGNLDGTPADYQAKRLQGHRSGAGIQNHAAAFIPDSDTRPPLIASHVSLHSPYAAPPASTPLKIPTGGTGAKPLHACLHRTLHTRAQVQERAVPHELAQTPSRLDGHGHLVGHVLPLSPEPAKRIHNAWRGTNASAWPPPTK